MKKIILLFFIFCPILGFFRATFFSDSEKCNFQNQKSNNNFFVISYYPDSLSKAVSKESIIIFKSSAMKKHQGVFLSEEGFVEKRELLDFKEFLDCQVLYSSLGSKAVDLQNLIDKEIKKYPFLGEGNEFVGPNQNTLTNYLIYKLKIDRELPSNCSGKDYLGSGLHWFYRADKNVFIASFSGYIGVKFSSTEALINLLGMSLGYNWEMQNLILPGLGDVDVSSLILHFKSINKSKSQ